MVTEGDKSPDERVKEEEKKEEGAEEKKPKSNWLSKIRNEQLNRESRLAAEKEERAKRLKALLDSDDEDNNEQNFNYKEMVGDNLTDFLSKIENHVRAEQKILDAWVDKDEKIKVNL